MTEWILKKVDYQYKKSAVKTLDGINGSFQTAKSYQVFGDSGSGKSTFLALLAGLIVCTEGALTVAGAELAELDRNTYRGHTVACLFQEGSLLEDSAMANLEMEMLLSGSSVDKVEIAKVLLSVGLTEKQLNISVTKLSKKDRQLVSLAKLLVKKRAELILVDEPEQVFSDCGVAKAMRLLKKHCLQNDTCLIFTTQTTQSVSFADELWGLNRGKLLFIKEQHSVM